MALVRRRILNTLIHRVEGNYYVFILSHGRRKASFNARRTALCRVILTSVHLGAVETGEQIFGECERTANIWDRTSDSQTLSCAGTSTICRIFNLNSNLLQDEVGSGTVSEGKKVLFFWSVIAVCKLNVSMNNSMDLNDYNSNANSSLIQFNCAPLSKTLLVLFC